MKKKLSILSILISFVLLASGCSLNNAGKVYDDEKAIARNYDTYNLVFSSQSMKGDQLSGSADKLEGMGTIWKLNAKQDVDVTITYQLNVTSGKAKLVLIAPDNTLTTLAECKEDSDSKLNSETTFTALKGKNRIKLIGAKDTCISYKISVNQGKMSSFGD